MAKKVYPKPEIVNIKDLMVIKDVAVKLINQSYKNSYGEIFVDMNSLKELAELLNMTISDIRPWHR